MRAALALFIAYLLGSIPFGFLIVRFHSGGDIRETGSGGTGATNVSRKAGTTAGLLTLLLDALKGVAAVMIARWIVPDAAGSAAWWVAAATIAVLLGHIFPIWLRFRGGKGVATGVGVLLVLAPWAVFLATVVFIFVVLLTRYVSLGSIVAAASLPFFILAVNSWAPISNVAAVMVVAVFGALLIIYAHRGNIERLRNGTESKFW